MTYINQLIKKYRSENFTKEDLDNLIDVVKLPVHEEAVDVSMYMHWEECDNMVIGSEERYKQILAEIHHVINLKASKPNFVRRLYVSVSRAAAILLIPLMVTLYIVGVQQGSSSLAVLQNTITVPLGATSNFVLPDGTQVSLNSGTTLTYPTTFASQSCREVLLSGEGFFKVKKDKACPFIVKMNGMDIRVTGTTFNARAYKDEPDVIVALIEGSVLLGKQQPSNTFELKSALHPMEVAVLNKADQQITLSQKNDLTKYIAWTQGRILFDNDPIQTVTQKLEKLYNIHVVISDKELLKYQLTATFTNEPLDRALKIISLSSPISYRILNGERDNDGVFKQRTLILRKENKYHLQRKY